MKRPTTISLLLLITLAGLLISCGCQQHIEGVFATANLRDVQRMAVLGLTPEHEQIFMANFLQVFQDQPVTFVERAALNKILGEQDLLKDNPNTPAIDEGRLNGKTRARIKQLLGVDALAICSYPKSQGPSPLRKFRVRIVMTETGAIVASAIVEAPDHFQYASYTAVKQIHAYLLRSHLVNLPHPYPGENSLR